MLPSLIQLEKRLMVNEPLVAVGVGLRNNRLFLFRFVGCENREDLCLIS